MKYIASFLAIVSIVVMASFEGTAVSAAAPPDCKAFVRADPSDPMQFTTVTVAIVAACDDIDSLAGTPMSTTWYYRTTTATCSSRITADEDGHEVGYCERFISGATRGYTVRVRICLDIQGWACWWTSFTPR